MRQSGIWPILCQLMNILTKLLDMDFKFFVLPSIYINFNIQTNLKVNQTQIGHSIPKNTPKITISKHNFSQCHSPKSLLLLHFSMNLSETFRINVNMDLAHTNCGLFFYSGPQKNFEPKIQDLFLDARGIFLNNKILTLWKTYTYILIRRFLYSKMIIMCIF